MEYLERNPLPEVCKHCTDDCYACDHAGERWYLSEIDSLKLKRKLKEQAISRFQREIAEIDARIALLEKQE